MLRHFATILGLPIASAPHGEGMKLSVVMPAQNEEGSVGATVEGVIAVLERQGLDYEVVVVNDDSEDSTEAVRRRDW